MIESKQNELKMLYHEFGVQARRIVMEEYANEEIRLSGIRAEEILVSQAWRDRKVDWDWEQLVKNSRKRVRRIELSIWKADYLGGLALGRVSDGRLYARIDRLERAPGENPLKGLIGEIATRYLEVVGGIAGCSETVIVQPLPELVEFYGTLGYKEQILQKRKLWGLKRQITPYLALASEEFTL